MVERIKELGRNKHMSLNEIEKACNIGVNTIYRWDKASPSADKLCTVADYFGVSVDSLLGREGKNTPGVRSELEELYAAASAEDKAVIDLILSKYKKECQIGLGVS